MARPIAVAVRPAAARHRGPYRLRLPLLPHVSHLRSPARAQSSKAAAPPRAPVAASHSHTSAKSPSRRHPSPSHQKAKAPIHRKLWSWLVDGAVEDAN